MSLYDTRAIDKVKIVMMKGETGGGGVSALADLDDVNLTALTDGQVIKYNSLTGVWENANEGSNVSALTYACAILSISGNDITTLNSSTQGDTGNIILLSTGNYHGFPTTAWRLGFLSSASDPTKWYYLADSSGQNYSDEIKANTTLVLALNGTVASVIDIIEDQIETEYGLTFTASVTSVANDRIAATSPDDESGKIGNIILVNTGSYSGSTTNGWGIILSHTTAGLPTFISALYDLSGNAYTEDIKANTTLVIQIRPASVDGIATLITVIGESSGGGGNTSQVRYNVVTKSTGGWDAAITVKKYVDGALESSLDYLYTDLTTAVTFDDCFTIYYNGADYIYTLLTDSTTHTSGYTYTWAYSDDVDFEDTFVIEKIVHTMAGAGKAVSESNHVITTDIELTRQPVSGDRFLLYCETIYSSPTGIIVDVNGTPTTIDFSIAVTNLQGLCLLKVISFGATLGLLVDYISKQLTAGRGITISSGQINNALVDTLGNVTASGNVTAGGNITDGAGNKLSEAIQWDSAKTSVKKNLMPPFTTTSMSNVTFTVASDGTVSLSGTSNSVAFCEISNLNMTFDVPVKLTGCPSGGAAGTYRLDINNGANDYFDIGDGFTLPANVTINNIRIRIGSGVNTSGMVFKPMLRFASIADDTFAPYILDNVELASQIANLNFYLEQTVTLSTSAETTATFTSAKITANSLIDLAVSEWGLIPSNVVVASGTCTVTMPKVDSAHSVVVRIYVR